MRTGTGSDKSFHGEFRADDKTVRNVDTGRMLDINWKDALFDEFTPTFSTARRGGGFGVEKLLDTMKKNMQTKLTGEFGNWRGGAYRDAANQILQEIGMSSERADG